MLPKTHELERALPARSAPHPDVRYNDEDRGFALTEELAEELAFRLCVPMVDVFEVDPDATSTHALGGYAERSRKLAATLRIKTHHAASLERAEAVLVVDDVVTSGATFEACAIRLKQVFDAPRVYGAALAYTQTPQRLARAEAEHRELKGGADGEDAKAFSD